MIELGIKVTDPSGDMSRLNDLARILPKEMEKAHLRAASIIPAKIRASVRSLNVPGGGRLPDLAPMSQALRSGATHKPGGKLADKSVCRVWAQNAVLVAGWIDNVSDVAALWQDGHNTPITTRQRHYLHRQLGRIGNRVEVPLVSNQPARPVIDPIAAMAKREIPNWVLGAFNAIVSRKLKKARGA